MTDNTDILALYRAALRDYRPGPDDDDAMLGLKLTVLERLPPADRIIIVLYAELQSYRKLGQLMGLSHNTVRKEILRIRKEIEKLYEQHLHRPFADVADSDIYR